MKLYIKDAIYFDAKEARSIGISFENTVTRTFTRPNPDIKRNENMGISTRGVPRYLTMYRYDQRQDVYSVDRGCWRDLLGIITTAKAPVEIVDNRVDCPVKFPEFKLKLSDYQEAALTSLLAKSQGYGVLPTGAGKTVLANALIGKRSQKTLILVHTKELLVQWVRALHNCFGEELIVGEVTSGKKHAVGEHVTVATIQSLWCRSAKSYDKRFFDQFGMVILDEMHHVAASTFQSVIGKCASKYRYGFTATKKRRDGKSFFLDALFGDCLVELGYEDVAERVMMPRIVPVSTPSMIADEEIRKVRYKKIIFDYTKAFTLLAKDMARNMTILSTVMRELENPKSQILMLTKRVEHAKEMVDFLSGNGVPATILVGSGNQSRTDRESAMKGALDGSIRVIVGTSIADEGLDIVRLNRLMLTSPTSFSGILAQRLGRIMRKCDDKDEAVVYDFVDSGIPEFVQAWYRRRSFYQKHGMEIDYSQSSPEELIGGANGKESPGEFKLRDADSALGFQFGLGCAHYCV